MAAAEPMSTDRTALRVSPPLSLRGFVLVVALIETAFWLLVVWNGVTSRSDPTTRGLDLDVAIVASGVYCASAAPGFALAIWNRWLWLAALLVALPLAALVAGVIWFTRS
jgi:hypothetical protein